MKNHVLGALVIIVQLWRRVVLSVLNGRNIFQFILNFFISFSPVLIWLSIFKNAGLIPNWTRPPIHVKLAMTLDRYIFDIFLYPIYGITSLSFLVALCGALIKYQELELQVTTIPMDATLLNSPHSLDADVTPFFERDSNPELFVEHYNNNNGRVSKSLETPKTKPLNCWCLATPILVPTSWFILNLVYWFRDPIRTPKDLLAWFLYVVCHLVAPIFTAIWLYLFQPPGALRLFSLGLGIQNIAGVVTHLIFPNVPPWYIYFYGEETIPDYDMPGFAAGLIRIDMIMGTHIHTAGFHISPIVFGALPSLHSAMAVMVFLFVSYYSRNMGVKIAYLLYVVLQWWATIYLDHHWRLDLIVGMLYSIASFSFLLFWSRGLSFVERNFILARKRCDFKNGSTAGMRIFRNTKLQTVFDPYS
ncbi:putative inositol phosphoesterase [Scheffersomyces stipitis CBS 6054]|uniref:Inositolphosphotransferase 1 n=1 Tax=Scheffersomyces stipitis (strain ATCC 58785 / CBS 6054 / NBRC 10063 / NRRL Y-11545) TaxID=322104 RepID=A3LZ21_PICST|nr:Inositolphosphotransferase 1 [Scheffersomyces stipitis CBS 6054]XP_001386292.2 putative inositol phosphoesterase [Scheffersomyces stipitis CBS 6054]ABN68081.2 Inositolphosphotransferase 1 [Scheffersomyces stipitis CBS 6054]ABN68263.2 putative inositol phosphoesterase [Scheffersomyces stipitis CBS 6054]